jgi:trans-AT polyketide synthase, acyltransferase and oxidoreductase domains
MQTAYPATPAVAPLLSHEDTIDAAVASIKTDILHLNRALRIARRHTTISVSDAHLPLSAFEQNAELTDVPAINPEQLGSAAFCRTYGTRFAYYGGAMANAIASEDMVIALGRAGFMGVFGAGGCLPARIEKAIHIIQQALPHGPYAFNLIHSPNEPALEQGSTELYLKHGVHVVEASAFLSLTPHIVRYRAAGLALVDGKIQINNRVIAKISRPEVAVKFMRPAPADMLEKLVAQGLISAQQAELALQVPMADDITVEADSGGHTDNRPLVVLLPTILTLREQIRAENPGLPKVRVGAGGGIATPQAAYAVFGMGADYIVTGSVNQSCIEAGTSDYTRKLLCQADVADVAMAPASDMFEMGVKLQVLKRGTFFPMRAQKLYEFYLKYPGIDAIETTEREMLEKQIFRQPLESVWAQTVEFFQQRAPDTIALANQDPKKKMALIFRWYLGLSSHWSNRGEPGREVDYQIWAGPAMGAFNAWVKGTALESHEQRRVADIAYALMFGAALTERLNLLRRDGIELSISAKDILAQKNYSSPNSGSGHC